MNRNIHLIRWLAVVALLLSVVAVPGLGAAPDTVTAVNLDSPTQVAPAYAHAGGTFTLNYTVTSNNASTVEVRYSLGTTDLSPTDSVAVVGGANAKTKQVTVPAGFAAGMYDVKVCAREQPYQTDWVCDTETQALVVDNTNPTATLTAPNGGESWPLGSGQNITWTANDLNLGANPISLYLSMDGGATWPTTIATGLANTPPYLWNVGGGMGTQCRVKVVVPDKAGNQASDASNANFTIYGTDNSAPVVNLLTPAAGTALAPTYIRGASYVASGTANDPESGIAATQFSYSADGGATWPAIGAGVFGVGQYTANWNTTSIADGTQLSVKFWAQNGQGASASDVNDFIVVDNSAPSVSLTAPTASSFIGGLVNVGATASDPHSGIVQVTFEFSPTLGAWGQMAAVPPTVNPDPTSPYAINWNTAGLTEGPAKLRAKADNGAGAQTTSTVVNVTIDNTPPALTPPVIGRPLAGAVWQIGNTEAITWRTAAITDLNLAANPITLYYSSDLGANWTQLATGLPNNGSYSWNLTGLVPSANYLVRLEAADKAGNKSTADSGQFTIWGQDTTPPSVNLTAPANGAWFNGAGAPPPVAVAANAADAESGIQSVEFFSKQGAGAWTSLGVDNTAPYGVNWPIAGLNGAFQLKATALNGVGMTTDSAAVTVNVDSSVPAVTLDQPADGSTIWGQAYEFKATATDAQSGVTQVEFSYWDAAAVPPAWVPIGTDTTSPYTFIFDTSSLADGWYQMKAKATNGVGATNEDVNNVQVDNTYGIGLQPGWNLISLPVMPYNTDINALLAGLPVKQVSTFVWEGGALVQKIWTPGFSTFSTMVDGQGYWIEMNQASTLMVQGLWAPGPGQPLPSYSVSAGWNMIGYTPMGPANVKTVNDYLSPDLGTTISAMYGFNPFTKLYTIMLGTTGMDYGAGYWLAVTASGTIYP
jgi:hypothetical protein